MEQLLRIVIPLQFFATKASPTRHKNKSQTKFYLAGDLLWNFHADMNSTVKLHHFREKSVYRKT